MPNTAVDAQAVAFDKHTFGTDILTTEEALESVERVLRGTIGRSSDA